MARKIDWDNAAKKVEGISNTIDIIMRNRLFIAFFLVVDGITFIMNPEATLPEMAKNIMLLVILAAAGILITNLAAKTRDIKTIVISTIVIILGIIFYFYPDLISAYLQLLLALFIIYDGATNIANALNLNRLLKFNQTIAEKYNKIINRKQTDEKKLAQQEKFKDVDDSVNGELEQQKKKLVAPLKSIIGKTSKSSRLYIVANVASVILGIILLVFPGVSMTIWGLIFLYTGLPNLLAAIKSMELVMKIKNRQFKQILSDLESGDEQKQDNTDVEPKKTNSNNKKNKQTNVNTKPKKTNPGRKKQ